MSACQRPQAVPRRGVPHLDIDPFSIEFFEDPHPGPRGAPGSRTGRLSRQMERLWRRPLCRSPCRPQRSPDLLLQPRRRPERFCQGKGVAAAKHHSGGRPAGTYAHAGGAEPGALADGDEAVARQLLSPPPNPGSKRCSPRQLRRHRRSRRGLSAVRVSRCARAQAGGARKPAALCEPRLQFVRAAEPAAPGRDRALGAASGLCRRTMPARKSRARRFWRLHPCPRRCRRHHGRGGAAAGALAAQRGPRYHRQRHRRRGLLPGALSRSMGTAAQRPDAGAQRL